MASQIESILDDIAAWTPNFMGTAPKVWNIDQILTDATLVLPKRILMVPETSLDPFSFVALGKRATNIWTITDRLYMAPQAETGGFERYNGEMIRYVANYITAAQNDRGLANNQAHVVSLTSSHGVFDWPIGSGQNYYGVDIVIEVQEVI
jgi:hypothetical protein